MRQDLGDNGGVGGDETGWVSNYEPTWPTRDVARPSDDSLTFLQRGFLRTGLGSLYLALAFWTLVLVILLRALAMYVGGMPGGAAHHPDAFAEMYWLSMPVLPGLVLASGWILRRYGRSWLTTLTVSGGVAAGLVLLVPLMAASSGPHMLAWTTLGLHRIAVFILPMALLAGIARVLVSIDRFARREPFRAGVFGTGAMALALSLTVLAATDEVREDDVVLFHSVERSVSVEPVNLGPGRPAALRGLYLAFATEVAALEQGLPITQRGAEERSRRWANNAFSDRRTDASNDPFGTCLLDLFELEAETQRRRARAARVRPADVEDLVMTAMLKVCERHALGLADEPRPYLQRTIDNALRDHYRTRHRTVACDVERSWEPRQESSFYLQEVQHAMCGLDDRDRTALTMAAYGYSASEIAYLLEETEDNARQIVSRSRARIREALR